MKDFKQDLNDLLIPYRFEFDTKETRQEIIYKIINFGLNYVYIPL